MGSTVSITSKTENGVCVIRSLHSEPELRNEIKKQFGYFKRKKHLKVNQEYKFEFLIQGEPAKITYTKHDTGRRRMHHIRKYCSGMLEYNYSSYNFIYFKNNHRNE